MKTSLAINQQVPEFVRAEYPVFVEFLKAYYKWYEDEFIPGNIEELLDIDYTIDEYVKYFRNQLDIHGITIGLDDRSYLKRIKEIYHTKGSFQGIEFLLQLTQNQHTSVITPWDYVFKPSDGKWHQDISIIVNVSSGNIDSIINNQITFTDINGKDYKTFVINVNELVNNRAEIFVSRFQSDSILSAFTCTVGPSTVSGTCIKTTSKVKIKSAGSGFRIGQVFTVNSTGGSGTLVKIKQVNEQGSIRAIEIIKFGTGYTQDFTFTITPPDLGYYITRTDADLQFTIGSICVYPGYYQANDNIIGDTVYIQDSKYYQAFSYVTSLESNIDAYANLLRKTMHPAGSRHFANYQLNNNFQLVPEIEASLNIISKRDFLRDTIEILEALSFDDSIIQADSVTVIDEEQNTASYKRDFSDSVTPSEVLAKTVQKGLTDTYVADELLSSVTDYIREFSDASVITDSASSTVELNLTDTTTIISGQYYVDTNYWISGYTEADEEVIANLIYEITFNDAATVTDSASSTVEINLTDTATATETLDTAVGFNISLSDASVITDSASSTVELNLTDTTTIISGQYYVDTNYWISGYTEADEEVITNLIYEITFNDAATVTDDTSSALDFNLAEEAIVTDDTSSVIGFNLADTATITEGINIETGFNLSVNDSVQINYGSPSGVYNDPYYVEQSLSSLYWNPGYIDSEREFTN